MFSLFMSTDLTSLEKMPQKCCVPGCSKPNGHTFPPDSDMERREKWFQAIKRMEYTAEGKLVVWRPKTKKEIVCREHYTPNDYRQPQYGSIGMCSSS